MGFWEGELSGVVVDDDDDDDLNGEDDDDDDDDDDEDNLTPHPLSDNPPPLPIHSPETIPHPDEFYYNPTNPNTAVTFSPKLTN